MRLKARFYVGLLCMLAVGFASCSDDDDDKGKGNDNGGVAQELPSSSDVGIKFPVQACMKNGYLRTYRYDGNGRMLACVSDEENFVYNSNPLSVHVTYSKNGSDANDWKSYENIRVNTSGFMTSCDGLYYEDHSYGEIESGSFSGTFTYNADGHILSEDGIMTCGDEENYEKWTMTFTWTDGNLMKIVTNSNYKNTEEEEEGTSQEIIEFAYDKTKYSNSGLYYFADVVGGTWLLDSPSFFYTGLMGRTTKNIPTSYTITYSENGEVDYSDSYMVSKVEYNADGSIRLISADYYDSSYSCELYYGYAGYPLPDWSYGVAPQLRMKGLRHYRTMLHR